MIFHKILMAERQIFFLKFAEKLYRDLAPATEAPPPLICCLHNNELHCTNYGLTKDSEINVFTVTLCLTLNYNVFYA
jgi:hypothetical protein